MGQTIKLKSESANSDIDTDLFAASLRDEGFATNTVVSHDDTVIITVSTSLMDDQFSDDSIKEDLMERAVAVADTFDLAVVATDVQHFRSEDSE